MAAEPDHAVQRLQMLTRLVGLGLATATGLTREVFCRSFADRRAIAGFVGLTGTPFNSGGSEREQGHQQERQSTGAPHSVAVGLALAALSAGQRIELLVRRAHRRCRGRIRKIMVVALARKVLVALWRYVETGELPAGFNASPQPPERRWQRI